MNENKVARNDHYNYALPELAKIQRQANVHYTDDGYEYLAKKVAESIETALKQ